MDPLSATTGALAICEICVRVVKYLKNIRQSVKEIDEVIGHLVMEVDAICCVVVSTQQIIERYARSDEPFLKDKKFDNLLNACERSLHECENIANKIGSVISVILGERRSVVPGKRDAFAKERRRRGKAEEIQELRDRLMVEKSNLQVLLIGMDIFRQDASQEAITQLLKEMRAISESFRQRFEILEENTPAEKPNTNGPTNLPSQNGIFRLRESIRTVQTGIYTSIRNEFFDTPQPVSSFYTGRKDLLQRLQNILIAPMQLNTPHGQLRFVIHGMGGSGKTQFCCKFAEVNRKNFWGVFYVDASSHDTIKQSYARIGELASVEHNYLSAMHWLSNSEGRWLLIMDNADDPHIDLSEYFPRGDRGCLLITTRNPDHIQYGNASPGFFEFEGMSDDEASTLLLRAARMKEPWDDESSSCALTITRQLGSLALAVVQAGAAIRCHLCKLQDYLGFYDRQWARIRHLQTSIPRSGRDRDNRYLSAHTTFEVSYRKLEEMGTEASRDALELLKMLSFFHPANIRFDILRKAIENRTREDTQQRKAEEEGRHSPWSWYQFLRNLRLNVVLFVCQDRSPPALPDVIKEGRASGVFDDFRTRSALRELVQMSLITYHPSSDIYHIHPVIHKWARERPDMSASEQAVWAHAAALTLGYSILLPPLGETEEDEIFRRDLLPHVDHVRNCQLAIDERIQTRRKGRFKGFFQWPGPGSSFGHDRALRYMKFGFVFTQNGRWKDAEELQLEVKRFADSVIGLDHSATRRITLALSDTYWNQGRGDEAGVLQESVLQACLTHLPPGHHETLLAMDTLGQTRWQQGRYSVARDLQRHVVEGFLNIRQSKKDEDTLCAMGHLGRTLAKFHESLDEAKELLEITYEGMKGVFGPTHLKSLAVHEDLVMLAVQTKAGLPSALRSMRDILNCRREKLGREHPYTLLAMVNLSRVLTAIGQYGEAEGLVREGLSIASRTLGEHHIGTLMGKTVLGAILTHQLKLDEAESILRAVIEKQRSLSVQRGDFHPDRIGAMVELTLCLRKQGNLRESAQLCDTVVEALKEIGQKEHPLVAKMEARRDEMLKVLGTGKDHVDSCIK